MACESADRQPGSKKSSAPVTPRKHIPRRSRRCGAFYESTLVVRAVISDRWSVVSKQSTANGKQIFVCLEMLQRHALECRAFAMKR
jgi:hypothetical protein